MESLSLIEEGFVDLEDLGIGERIREFERKDFPFRKAEGLDFLTLHILDNQKVRSLIGHFFGDKPCVLAHCLRYGPLPGHIESFLGGRDAGQRALMVQLLAEGSQLNYYAYSHLQAFPAEKGPRLTREVPQAVLHDAGCEVRNKDFRIGGSVVLDARLCLELRQGYAITIVFMTEDLVARFKVPPMPLPNLPTLEEKVKDMQKRCGKIRLNFVFVALQLAGKTPSEKVPPESLKPQG